MVTKIVIYLTFPYVLIGKSYLKFDYTCKKHCLVQ